MKDSIPVGEEQGQEGGDVGVKKYFRKIVWKKIFLKNNLAKNIFEKIVWQKIFTKNSLAKNIFKK